MKKKILLIPLVLLLAISLVATGCPAPPVEVPAEIAELEREVAAEKAKVAELEEEIVRLRAPAEVYKLRLQQSWGAAENHFFEQYADIVREMSGGRIDIAIFSDGEIVTWDELPDAVATGMIDMGHSDPCFLTGVIPVGLLAEAPYLYRNLDEAFAVLYGYGLDDVYTDALEAAYGLKVIGWQPDDFAGLIFTREIDDLDDMEGMVISVGGGMAEVLGKIAGVSTTYMAAEEIYTALATGVIDGASWGGVKCMYDMGYHDVAKFVLLPNFVTAYFCFYFISPDLWNELPADLQATLTEAMFSNTVYMRAYYAYGETKALKAMQDAGVKPCYLPDEDMEAIFQEAVKWLKTDYAALSPASQRASDLILEALRDFGRID